MSVTLVIVQLCTNKKIEFLSFYELDLRNPINEANLIMCEHTYVLTFEGGSVESARFFDLCPLIMLLKLAIISDCDCRSIVSLLATYIAIVIFALKKLFYSMVFVIP